MKKITVILSLALAALLAGCGKQDKELQDYYDSMTAFTDEVTTLSDSMNEVNPYDEDANYEMLGYLDEMEEQFKILAEMEVPEQFSINEELADEAYEYMQTAVGGFHEFYEDPTCDYSTFEIAKENYSRSLKRIEYISIILKGEIPEGENIEVTEEESTDFNPVTDDAEDED